jgi:hypothetical protein
MVSRKQRRRIFGINELADDALAVLEASGATSVIPVASAHSGWVALELHRRLGHRIEGIVSLEWFVLGLPRQLREALAGMQSPDRWRQVVEGMHQRWLNGVENPDLERFLRVGMSTGFSMWSRAGREITAAFDRNRFHFRICSAAAFQSFFCTRSRPMIRNRTPTSS